MTNQPSQPRVMVTGGAGYIGSHACLSLLESGHRVVAVDNLARGHRGAIENLAKSAPSPETFEFIEASLGCSYMLKKW